MYIPSVNWTGIHLPSITNLIARYRIEYRMSQSLSGESFEERSTSQRVIMDVAEVTGNDPTEVGPLYHVIDPDALDRLFTPTGGSGRTDGYVEFTFAGCDVVVSGGGEIDVTECDSGVGVASGESARAQANHDQV